MSSDSPNSEDTSSSSPDPFALSATPSPESDGSDAEKVEELRAILVRSESDEMPGLHTLALNPERRVAPVIRMSDELSRREIATSVETATNVEPATFERWVRVPPEEELQNQDAAQRQTLALRQPSHMHDILHPESFTPNHLAADPLAFSTILANDAATPGYEVSIVRDGTRMVWVKVVTLDEEMVVQEQAMYPPEVFLRGASLLRNIPEFWE